LSPRTKLVILTLLVGVLLTSLLYLIGSQFGFGYFSSRGVARIVMILALSVFAAFRWIAQKIGKS